METEGKNSQTQAILVKTANNKIMIITASKRVEIKVEVEFPAYRSDLCHLYKVINENQCLCVCTSEERPCISVCHSGIAWEIGESDCTEEEFTEAFTKVMENLIRIS